jgi:hypothetical protein
VLKAIARCVPQIDRLVQSRDDLIQQVESLRRDVQLFRPDTLSAESRLICPLFERMKDHLAALPPGSRELCRLRAEPVPERKRGA